MPGPDLTQPRATLESIFDAECTIVNDPDAETDDYFDDTTLTSSRPAGDSTTIYTGPCLLRPVQGLGQQRGDESQSAQFLDVYRLRIEVGATVVPIGAVATITRSPNDLSMVDREFTVSKRLGGSYAVSRIMLVQERTRGPRI